MTEPAKIDENRAQGTLGARVCGALYLALAAASVFPVLHDTDWPTRKAALVRALVQGLIALGLMLGDEKMRVGLKDVIALLVGAGLVGRTILTGLSHLMETPMAFAFDGAQPAVQSVTIGAGILLLLIGRPGLARMTAGVIVFLAGFALPFLVPGS